MARRRLLSLVTAATLIVAAPASAQTVEPIEEVEWQLRSGVAGIVLTQGDELLLHVGQSDTRISHAPYAWANTLGAVSPHAPEDYGKAVVETRDGHEAVGPQCARDAAPAAGFRAGLICTNAEAMVVDGIPSAVATAGLQSATFDGTRFLEPLAVAIEDALESNLPDAVQDAKEAAVTDLEGQLDEICATSGDVLRELPALDEALAELGVSIDDVPLPDAVDAVDGAIPDAVDDVAQGAADPADDAVGDVQGGVDEVVDDVVDGVGGGVDLFQVSADFDPCVLRALVDDVAVPTVDNPVRGLGALLMELFEGVGLLEVNLATRSVSLVDDEVASTETGLDFLELTIGSLANDQTELIADEILAELEVQLEPLAQRLRDSVSSLGDLAPATPTAAQLAEDVVDRIGFDILRDPEPLLQVRGADATSISTVDLLTGATTHTPTAGAITGQVSPALAALFGTERDFVVNGGETQVFGQDTPLQSTYAVGGTAADDVEASSEGFTLTLFDAVPERTLRLAVGSAASGGDAEVLPAVVVPDDGPAVDPAPAPDLERGSLPNTGGGAALVGLAALGAAWGLRRPRA